MKKQATTLIVGVFLLGVFSGSAQSDKAIKNGMDIKFSLGFPSTDYALPGELIYGEQYSVIFGLQLSSRWYISPQETWAVGILANYLDLNFGFKNGPNDSYYKATLQASGLGVGPIGTYKLMDDMALDAYYNIRPTGMFSAIVEDGSLFVATGEDYDIGLTHAVGLAFRYNVLMVGVEFNFGEAGMWELSDDDFYTPAQKVGNTRIFLGVKL